MLANLIIRLPIFPTYTCTCIPPRYYPHTCIINYSNGWNCVMLRPPWNGARWTQRMASLSPGANLDGVIVVMRWLRLKVFYRRSLELCISLCNWAREREGRWVTWLSIISLVLWFCCSWITCLGMNKFFTYWKVSFSACLSKDLDVITVRTFIKPVSMIS